MIVVPGLVAVSLTAAVQLVSVTIDVTLGGEPNRAVVEGSYVFEDQADSVRFILAKFAGQSVRITRDDWRLRESDGLFELVLPGSGSPFDVQYTIDGPVTHIPLFVPDTPTEPGGRPVEIRVRGVGDVSLKDVFPRFQESGGELLAELDNVPSAIWLPSRRTLSTNRLADLAVIVVLVMGTALWLLRNRISRVTVAPNVEP